MTVFSTFASGQTRVRVACELMRVNKRVFIWESFNTHILVMKYLNRSKSALNVTLQCDTLSQKNLVQNEK